MNVHEQFAVFFDDLCIQPYAYLISKKLSEGHICVELDEIILSDGLKDSIFEGIKLNTTELKRSKLVSESSSDKQPFVINNDKLYLQRYFSYESQIIDKIGDFIAEELSLLVEREMFLSKQTDFLKETLAEPPSKDAAPDEKIDWQLAGAILGYLHNFTIITGGPGTGKTTTVAKILAILYRENPKLKVALTAPTGKAGIRMLESLKSNKSVASYGISKQIETLNSSTIHRLLGYRRNSPYFKHNANNYLMYDVVIVDEASMIDVALFSKLLSAIDPTKRVILLGDKDQLASVEAGSLLGDLSVSQLPLNRMCEITHENVNSFIPDQAAKISDQYKVNGDGLLFEHIIELKKSHRFKSDSGIGKLSKAIIRSNETIVSSYFANIEDSVTIDQEYNESLFQKFVLGYKDYINDDIGTALHSINKYKVLCATRNGNRGLYAINKKIENILKSSGLITVNDEFYENRPIIVTKNYKDLDLYNGDIGIIRTDTDGVKKAYFLDNKNNVRRVLPGFISECETVYAMTIHKSQGSEYENVLVVLPENSENALLTKELLYTAVTRAKETITIQGTKEVVLDSINKGVNRASGITNRIA